VLFSGFAFTRDKQSKIMSYLALAAGALIIAAILHDAFEVMLLPRRVKSKTRIVRYFFQASWAIWRAVARRLPAATRSSFLGLYGPLSLVALLIVWAAGLIAGFSLLFWALNPGSLRADALLHHVYFSGVTFFTLGYGDFVPQGPWSKALSIIEAGTGLGFIAMVIGYLPVLYQLFSRREAHVILLDSVAGSPPTAMELLARHARARSMDTLDALFSRWQQWSAELLESQLSYPMLAYYRSQHDNQSWLAAIAALMDATAFVMLGLEGIGVFQARLTFATGRLAIVEMCRVLGVKPRTTGGDRIAPSAFDSLRAELGALGVDFLEGEGVEERFSAFRATYEPFLNGLAEHLVLTIPDWTLASDQLDNWANSPRGRTAKRLVEIVPGTPDVGS
jgi:hypothetical protein